eukprot:SAG22_NODE_1682_length_3817_cov_8.486283_1_plen_190_part_00
MVTGGGSLSLASLALLASALAAALAGLSGAGSRLVLEAVTVPERPEWGALTGTVTKADDDFVFDGLSSLANLPRFVVHSGPCTTALVDGHFCVGRWPGGYGPSEDCAIAVASGGGVVGGVLGGCPVFDTNVGPDSLTLPDGSRHSGGDCPAGAMLAAGQTLGWHSDGIWQGTGMHISDGLGGGWQVCFA